MASGKRYTIDEFKHRMNEINPNILIIDERYINNRAPIKCKCKICNNEWEAKPQHLLRGHGCITCHLNKISLSQKDIQSRVKHITILSVNKKRINCKCDVCGHKWNTHRNVLLENHGCPKCAIERRTLTNEEFQSRISKINDKIILLEEYKGINTKIKVKCNVCQNEYLVLPNNLLKGNGCRQCYINNKTLSESSIKSKLDKDICLVGKYKNTHTKTTFLCKRCNQTWEALPSSVLYGNGCPKCNSSKGEKEIKKILEKKKMFFEQQKKFPNLFYKNCKNKLSYDFYLPHNNLLIEYNGKQHYEAIDRFGGEEQFREQQYRDELKKQYASTNSLNLLVIKYNENIEEKLNKYI